MSALVTVAIPGQIKNLELHPLCTLFPRIKGAEFDALVSDIKANGLREPIIIHDGMILDGGNRYRACIEAGVEPAVMKFGGGNLVTYVLSANLHRRHLSAGQQAAIVASAQDWANAQTHGGNRKQDQAARLPLETVAERATASGSGERTQRMADKVAKADPELAKQVGRGEISLPRAVEQITGKRPGSKPSREVMPVHPEQDDDMRAEMLADAMDALREENESLSNQIAAMLFSGTKEEKARYLARLDELTEENRKLHILNRGLTEARDRVMLENVSLRKQGEYSAKKLKALAKGAAT